MKLFYFIFLFFTASSNFIFAEEAATDQLYSKKLIPSVTTIEKEKITLSDGSVWKKANESEDLSKAWSTQDQVMIRWDKNQSKYFLHNISRNSKLDTRDATMLVDLLEPSRNRVHTFNDHTLTLSDGTIFEHIPFIGPLHTGNRVLISWNENPKGKYYPYIIVDYISSQNEETTTWEMSGEVQARLVHSIRL